MSGPWDEFGAQTGDAGAGPWAEFSTGSESKPKKKSGGILADIGTTLVEGTKSAGRAIAGTADVYTGNEQSLIEKSKAQEAAQANKPEALQRFNESVATRSKALGEDPGLLDSIKAVGGAVLEQPKGAGLAIVEQLPNSAPAMAGGLAGMKLGGMAGTAVAPGVGTAVGGILGGVAGMFAGNTAIETGNKAIEAAQDGSVSPEEMAQIRREGAVKGGVITGVDALTLGASKAITNAGARAVETATRKALTDAGVDVASEAAVLAARQSPEISSSVRAAQEAALASSNTLGKRAAAGGAALGLETVGEGVGEYFGELAATGKANMVDAVLESVLSLGQSGAEVAWGIARNKKEEGAGLWNVSGGKYAETKAAEIAGLLPAPTYTGTPGDQLVSADAERQAAIDAADKNAAELYAARDEFEKKLRQAVNIINEPATLQQRIDEMLNVDTSKLSGIERTNYEKQLAAAFAEPIGIRHDKDQREVPFTIGEYLDAQVALEDAVRNREKSGRAVSAAGARLQQLADEETAQQPDIAPAVRGIMPSIPVVGPLSKAANEAVQSGAHAATVMQNAQQAAAGAPAATAGGSRPAPAAQSVTAAPTATPAPNSPISNAVNVLTGGAPVAQVSNPAPLQPASSAPGAAVQAKAQPVAPKPKADRASVSPETVTAPVRAEARPTQKSADQNQIKTETPVIATAQAPAPAANQETEQTTAGDDAYRPLIESLIKNKRNAKQLGFDIDGAVQKAKDAMHGKKQMPGAFRNLANKAEKLGDTETASILRQIADMNDARKAGKKEVGNASGGQTGVEALSNATATTTTEAKDGLQQWQGRQEAAEKVSDKPGANQSGSAPENFDPDVQYAKRPDGSYKTKSEYTSDEWAAYTKSAVESKLKKQKDATPETATLPHEQTAGEWHKAHIEWLISQYDYPAKEAANARASEVDWSSHQDFLETALEDGKQIPQQVLDDYRENGIKVSAKEWPLLAKALADSAPIAKQEAAKEAKPDEKKAEEDGFARIARETREVANLDDDALAALRKYKDGSADGMRSPLQVTFVLKNLSDSYYLRLKGQDSPHAKYELLRNTKDLDITQKIGRGAFGDQVDLNRALKEGRKFAAFELAPRKGYVLATATIDLKGDAAPATVKESLPVQNEIGAQSVDSSPENTEQKTEAWHTPIPTQGLEIQQGDEKVDGPQKIVFRMAREAWGAITPTQRANMIPLYAYSMPSADGRHGIARLFPDDQTPPKPWVLLSGDVIRQGGMTNEQGIGKLADLLRSAPVIGEAKIEPKAAAGKEAKELRQKVATNPDEKEGADLTWAEVLDEAWNNGFETGNASYVPAKQALEKAYQRPLTDAQVAEYAAAYQGGARESDEKAAPPAGDQQPVNEDPPANPATDLDATIDDELADALGHLGDVLGEVFGGQMNITGKQYGAADLLPALSKVVELLVRKGYRSFKQSVSEAAKLMRGNKNTAAFVDQISARQWKAAYQSVAEFHEGTDAEDVVGAIGAVEVEELVGKTSPKADAAEQEAAAPDDSSPEAVAQTLDAEKIKAGYAHRALGGLGDKVTMERKWFADALVKMREAMTQFVRNDAQTAALDGAMEKFADDYKERRYRVLDVGSGVASSAVAGGSNFNSTQAGRRGNALDRAEADFNAWLEARTEAIKAELLRLRTNEEKQADADSAEEKRIKKAVSAVTADLATAVAIDKGEAPGMDRASFLAGAVRKIGTLHKSGDTEALRRVFSTIRQYNDSNKKPLFSDRHSVWKYEPKLEAAAEQGPVSTEPLPEVRQEDAEALAKIPAELREQGRAIVRMANIARQEGVPVFTMQMLVEAVAKQPEGTDVPAAFKATLEGRTKDAKDVLRLKASNEFRNAFGRSVFIKSDSQLTAAVKSGSLDLSAKPWAADFYDLFKIDPAKIEKPAAATGDEAVDAQIARFQAGVFDLPATATGTGKEGIATAKKQNDTNARNYTKAARIFLEGDMTAKVPSGDKASGLNVEFLENVRTKPIEKNVARVKDYTGQMKALLTIAAEDDIRYYLRGVHVIPEEKRMVATDGHRIVVLDNADFSGVPQMEEGKTVINRHYGEKKGPDTKNVWHDGRFPDWTRVVPPKHMKYKGEFDAKRVADQARGISKAWRYAKAKWGGDVTLDIGGQRTAVNVNFIVDMADLFRAFGYDRFTASFEDDRSPILFESPDGRVRQVVMPLRGNKENPVFLPIPDNAGVAKQASVKTKDAPDVATPDAFEVRGIDLENRGAEKTMVRKAIDEARAGDDSLLVDLERINGVQKENEKPLEIGDDARIMGVEVSLVSVEEIDGVRYELFKEREANDPRGVLRRTDIDSGGVVGIRTFNEYADVETAVAIAQSVTKPAAEKKSDAKNFRSIDALNPLTAPVEEGDWFRIGGKEWQARNGYTGRGWSLIDADKKTHPTIHNIEANSDLIREIVAADGAVETPAPTRPPEKTDEAAEDQRKRENPHVKTDIATHYETMKRLRSGEASLAEYKAAFSRLSNSEEEIKADLATKTKEAILRLGGRQFAYNYKSDKKDRIIDGLYRDMLSDFAIGRGISYVLGAKDGMRSALVKMVEGTTEETLKTFADKVAGQIAEYEKNREETKKAIADPQTVEDFRLYLRAKVSEGMTTKDARLALTPEQRIRFDTLEAEASRKARADRKESAATDVRVAAKTTEGQIIETKHTKTGEPLFVVKAAERVERDVYNQWNASAKRLGGWYSSFRGNGAVPGFQFKTRENADAFLQYLGGNTEAAKEAIAERRDSFADDRSQSAVERLNEMADRLEERADESLSYERKTNTARRARFAASAEAAASADKAMAQTMRNIAKAIEAGTAKFLDRVRQKVQVEMLQSTIVSAKYDELRQKYPSYSEQEKHRGEPATAETADYANWPVFTAYRSDLARLGRELSQIDGAKKLGQQLLKVADDITEAYQKFAKENLHKVSTFKTQDGKPAVFPTADRAEAAIARSGFKGKATTISFKRGEHLVIMGPEMAREAGLWQGDDDKRITLDAESGEALVAKHKELRGKTSLPPSFVSASESRARWKGLGIETAAEMRSALREFIGLRETAKAPDKIKELERAMIGRKNTDGLDFFPTPAETAQAMIEAAEITEGMAVLEPSAGMGHIAEQIREAGIDPDVVEFDFARRELLEAKGFNVVGRDFTELSPRGFTYGDVFRNKDGRLGVMRGSGGMGSGRVGFQPLDASGEPDARNATFENREELEGIEKRGTESGYDRILMNPPFSNRRDAEHVQHAYSLLKPGGRIVAIMGEGVFFGQDKKAQAFRQWLEEVGGTSEKLAEGTFMDPSLPVNTATNARMVVIDKPEGATSDNEGVGSRANRKDSISPSDKAIYGMAAEGKSSTEILKFIAASSRNPFYRQLAKLLLKTGIAPSITVGDAKGWKFNAGNDKKYAAAYNPKTDTVALFRPSAAERNMLHELVHAATIKALEKGGLSAAQMRALYQHVKKTGKLHGMYGMTDVDEFVTEAFTNPKFQEALKKVMAPQAGGKLSSAWQWFVRVVRGILGLKANDESALSAALEIGLGVMREDMQIRRGESGVPFSEITGREIERTLGRTLQEKATNWMRLNLQGKSFENDATGWDIAVGRKGINKAMSHGARDVHARSVAAIPDLLKHAILVASEPNNKTVDRMDIAAVHHFYAPFRMGGEVYIARMVVKETRGGQRFYDYDTSDVIRPTNQGADAHLPKEGAASRSAGREMSMANLLSHVKAEHGGTDPRFKIRHNVAEFFRGMGIEAGASGKMIESIRSDVQFVAGRDEKTGFPTWKGAHVSLSSPRDVTESHDVFYRPIGGERAVKYDIRSANGQIVGHTVLEIDGDWPTILLDIEVQKQHRGNRYAEKAVAGIVADAGEIGIWHIVQSARSWWERIGTQTVDAHNGTLAFNDYADARASREDAQSLGEDVGRVRYNVGGAAYEDNYDLSEERGSNRTIDRAELEDLRRAAARLERPRDGVFLRVTEDGLAIATGPKGARIPDSFRRFASEKRLTFRAERKLPQQPPGSNPSNSDPGITRKSEPMPIAYRKDGAMYFGEIGGEALDRTDRVRFNVADDGAWEVSEPSKMDDVLYALQDKHIDTKRVVQAIVGTGKKIRDAFNPYLQEELFHGRAAKGVKDFLDFELRPLLNEMQTIGVDMGDFEEYLWNRHAEERNRQIAKVNPDMKDGGSGIKTADARAYLAGLSAEQRQNFEALAAHIDQINAGSRQILIESGLEKAETIAAWEGAYKHYVPLQREDVESGHIGTGKGFSVRGSSTKRAMGSGRAVVDIIANLTMQRERNIVRAEKNRVSQAVMGLAVTNPNPDFWTVDKAPKERVVQEMAIYSVLDEAGNKVSEFTRMDDADKAARAIPNSTIEQTWEDRVTERVTPGFLQRDNVLLTRINGQDHYVIFNEREPRAVRMAQAMKNLDADNLGAALSVIGRATRYLASVNTQYNPVFGVINLIRDSQGAMLNLASTPLAGEQKRVMGYTVDALRGIYADIRARRAGRSPSSNWAQLFEEFQKEGGQTGYRDQYAGAEQRAEAIKSELAQFTEGAPKRLLRGVFGWLSDYNETMENAVRLASYKAAKEKGMSRQQAASLAKNITVNFNRKGQVATQVGALYAFFNASVQGTARIAETLFDPSNGDPKAIRLSKLGKKIVAGGIMLGSMQALLLAAAGFDDDEPPEFVRERNLVLPIGDGKYLTLAMPLGFHVLPGVGRIATEFAMSGFKDPAKRVMQFGSMLAEAFNPVGNAGFSLQTITPSVVDPFAALAENKDFTGKEIYRENFNAMNPTPGHARAKDVATVWSRAISEALNFITGGSEFKPGVMSWSPDAIDYLIGQATGGVGREVSKAYQTGAAATTGEDLPLYKVPLVGRFVGDTEGQSGQSAKFYEAIKQINMHEAEYKGLMKSGRGAEAREYMQDNPETRLIMAGNHAETQVRKLRSMKRDLIEKDADREKVREIDSKISETMRRFNERVAAAT